jgi:thiamine-phosphate pyrophosphorylase
MTVATHESRMRRFVDAGLYLVTSQALSRRPTLDVVRAALDGGVTLIQLREKELSIRELMILAHKVRELTSQASALLMLNDRLDVALACGADGVHLGQDDLPIAEARRLAPDLILGSSSHDLDEAVAAGHAGASYVNIGPVFPTKTKQWTGEYLGLEGVRAIAPHLKTPFSVMGGIKREHIPDLVKTGASAVALVTAVTQAADVRSATEEFLMAIAAARRSNGVLLE